MTKLSSFSLSQKNKSSPALPSPSSLWIPEMASLIARGTNLPLFSCFLFPPSQTRNKSPKKKLPPLLLLQSDHPKPLQLSFFYCRAELNFSPWNQKWPAFLLSLLNIFFSSHCLPPTIFSCFAFYSQRDWRTSRDSQLVEARLRQNAIGVAGGFGITWTSKCGWGRDRLCEGTWQRLTSWELDRDFMQTWSSMQ